jgi:hypothetical protein
MSIRKVFFFVAIALVGGCGSDDDEGGCPDGQTKRTVCVACGPAGGCGEEAEMCATPCQAPADCSGSLMSCVEGVCQVGGCL